MKGINIEKIGTIIQALKDYEKHIDNQEVETTKKNIEKAFKGSGAVKSVRAMCTALEDKIDQYTNRLKDYITRLEQVEAAYKQYDQTSSQTFAQGSKTIKNLKS